MVRAGAVLAAAVRVGAALAAATVLGAAPLPARAQDDDALALRFEVGATRRWSLTTETWVETRLLGGRQVEHARVVFVVRDQVSAVDAEGAATLACRFESVAIDRIAPSFGRVHFCAREHAGAAGEPPRLRSGSHPDGNGVAEATAALWASLPGQTFELRMATDGRIAAVSGMARVRRALLAGAGSLGDVAGPLLATTLADGRFRDLLGALLHVLPPAGRAGPGESWTRPRRVALGALRLGDAEATATLRLADRGADGLIPIHQELSSHVAAPADGGGGEGPPVLGSIDPASATGEGQARFDPVRGEVAASTLTERFRGSVRLPTDEAAAAMPIQIKRVAAWSRLES